MGEPRAVGDLVHVEKFFARNLGGLTRARTRAGPAREGRSRTPSMYADEKSDEVVVPRKRSNKGRQLPAEVVEGRASPEGNSRQAAVVRTLSRATTAIRLAAVRWCACGFKLRAADVRPEGGARCVSSARRDLCGGRSVMSVPTATMGFAERVPRPAVLPADGFYDFADTCKKAFERNHTVVGCEMGFDDRGHPVRRRAG